MCPQHRGRAHRLGATTPFLSERRLPGAPCTVPRHQLQQNLSPLPLYWKWCGLPYRVSNTTPTYLRNFWRSSPPSATVLEKYIIMMSAHWKRHDSSTPFPLCNLFLTNSIFWETVRPSFSQGDQGSPKCLQALSVFNKQPDTHAWFGFTRFENIHLNALVKQSVQLWGMYSKGTHSHTQMQKSCSVINSSTDPYTERGYALHLQLYGHYASPLLTKMYFHMNTTYPEICSQGGTKWRKKNNSI